MNVNEEIITSSTVQVGILNSNENKRNSAKRRKSAASNICRQGRNYQATQENIRNEQTEKRENKLLLQLICIFWLVTLVLTLIAISYCFI